MACYHPQLLLFDGFNDNGKPNYKFVGVQGEHMKDIDKRDPRDVLIPCRRCIGCRLDYSRRWADRLMLELDHSKEALFLTLTYDNEHVTIGSYDEKLNCLWYTLVKKDLQDFNKRLRYYFPDKEIRFYAAGEYGDKTLRPHFHGIYFGLSLKDFKDIKLLFLNSANQPLYVSEFLTSIWGNGHVSIGNISWQSCAYVARYNLKKLGNGDDNFAVQRGCIPEFSLMSRRPGIGGYFPIDHPEVFNDPRNDLIITDIHGVRNVSTIKMPNYIFNKLELVNPELYAIIKDEKKRASLDTFLLEMEGTDISEFEYLVNKESIHEVKSKSLIRPLE